MGEGDRPGLTDYINELVGEVAQMRLNADPEKAYPWAEVPSYIDTAESIDDLWIMESAAERVIAAGKEVLAEVRKRMASDVAEFGTIRLGDTLYRFGQKGRRKLIEGQEKMLLDWLGDDLKIAVPATAVRITAIRAIAEQRNLAPEAVEDTFYWWDADPDDPYELQRVWGSRLPNYFAAMKHGDRR